MAFDVTEGLTKETLYSRLDSLLIFKKYCSGFEKVGVMFKSEFREDKRPSCMITFWKGDWIYKDYGGSSFRPIDYVMHKYHLAYYDALHKINDDFLLGLDGSPYVGVMQNVDRSEPQPTVIRVKRRAWQDWDLSYWSEHGWTLDMLKACDISPISHFQIISKRCNKTFIVDKHAYSYDYYQHKGVFRRKVYQPYRTDGKWVSNVDNTIVQGYNLCPRSGKLLVITKSLKDIGPFYRMGIPALAPNGETTWFTDEYWGKIRARFDRIVMFWDNDTTGRQYAEKWATKYGIEAFFMSEHKDPSGYYKNEGAEKFEQTIKSMIL